MSIEIRIYKGKVRKTWYARIVGDKPRTITLTTKMRGRPGEINGKPTLKAIGDYEFERSRSEAEIEFKNINNEMKHKGRVEHIAEALILSKTGKSVEYVKLSDLYLKWREIPRENMPSETWMSWCSKVFQRFAETVKCTYAHDVTRDIANRYISELRKHYSKRTCNAVFSMLKNTFAYVLPAGIENPFIRVASRSNSGDGHIHRKPLTIDELEKLFEISQEDKIMHPLVVCCACTGMRIGDVCRLKWECVDTAEGIIAVKTSKTGKRVEIPILAPLQRVFEETPRKSHYVFPIAQKMYETNTSGIVYRGKVLFAKVFGKESSTESNGQRKTSLVECSSDVISAIKASAWEDCKKDRTVDNIHRLLRGQSYNVISAETGRVKSSISQDLRDAEKISGFNFRTGTRSGSGTKRMMAATRKKVEGRSRCASIYGWHSLRGTFATMAIMSGIPTDVVKLITGHSTVETILTYYFNPRREHIRKIISENMPDILTK